MYASISSTVSSIHRRRRQEKPSFPHLDTLTLARIPRLLENRLYLHKSTRQNSSSHCMPKIRTLIAATESATKFQVRISDDAPPQDKVKCIPVTPMGIEGNNGQARPGHASVDVEVGRKSGSIRESGFRWARGAWRQSPGRRPCPKRMGNAPIRSGPGHVCKERHDTITLTYSQAS